MSKWESDGKMWEPRGEKEGTSGKWRELTLRNLSLGELSFRTFSSASWDSSTEHPTARISPGWHPRSCGDRTREEMGDCTRRYSTGIPSTIASWTNSLPKAALSKSNRYGTSCTCTAVNLTNRGRRWGGIREIWRRRLVHPKGQDPKSTT